MNDGRGLVALGLLTLLGAQLVRGSRGVVRAGRKPLQPVYQTWQGPSTRTFAGFQSYAQNDREEIRSSTQALAKAFVSAVNADLDARGLPRVALPIWPPTSVERPQRNQVGVEFEIDMSDYPSGVPFGPTVEQLFRDQDVQVID
jgi:hypothetical protein